MSPEPNALEELERDALGELVNIGVSRAAMSLRKMVGEQVLLSVPSVEVLSRSAAIAVMRERESEELVAVRQEFHGTFSGRALLIFPEANSFELVRAVTHEALSGGEPWALAEEALAETGNVVLNGCLATMANVLKKPLTMSVPEVVRGHGKLFFESGDMSDETSVVLFLYINFAIAGRNIRGYIAMLLDMPSLQALRELIREFIARVMDSDELRDEPGDEPV